MEEILNINLFYPILFTTLIIIVITVANVIKKNMNCKLTENIFNRHAEEHIKIFTDTTDKMCNMHKIVVEAMKEKISDSHSKDYEQIKIKLDDIEKTLKQISFKIDEIDKKI